MRGKYVFVQIVLISLIAGCTIVDSHQEVLRTNSAVVEVDTIDRGPTESLNPYDDNASFEQTVTSRNGQTRVEATGVVTGSDGGYKVITDLKRVSENHFKVYVEARKPLARQLLGGGVTRAVEVFPYRISANLTEPFRLDIHERSSNRNESVRRIARGY